MVLPLDSFAFTLRRRMWDLLLGGADPVIEVFIRSVLTPLLLFTGVLFIVFVGIKVMTYFADINSKLDPFVLVRPILVMMAMTLYTQLVPLLIYTPIEVLNEVVITASDEVEVALNNKNITKTQQDIEQEEEAGGESTIFDKAVQTFFDILSWIIDKLAQLAPIFILAKQVLVVGLFYILGIFVLPLSLIPGNQSVLKGWFHGFFAAMLWLPLTSIMLAINLILVLTLDTGAGIVNSLLLILMQFVNLIMIFQVPKYAKILVTGGAQISTGTSQLAAAAASAAGSAASGGSKSLLKKGAK